MKYVQYLKNLSKPITLLLLVLTLVITIIAFILCYTNPLFYENYVIVKKTQLVIGEEINFGLIGTINFSNALIEASNTHTSMDGYFPIAKTLIDSAPTIKTMAIILMISQSFIFIVQLFDYRVFTTAITSVLNLIMFTIYISFAKVTYLNHSLITILTNSSTWIIVLLSISTFLSLTNLAINIITKYVKIETVKTAK